jgi:multidrug transporter EmrE-like cation transporter
MSYFYIFLTVILTVYGQIVIKWQVMKKGNFPVGMQEKVIYLGHLLFDPWILSALLAAFLASLTWVLCIAKLQLSVAYPFVSLSFVLVLLSSSLFFHEVLSPLKVIGMLLIVLGVIVGAQA